MGGTPPLTGKNPLSSFWQLPLGVPYLSDLHDLIAFDLSIKKQDDNFFKTYIQSFWSLRSSLCHNVYLFSTWVKKDFHFFSEHFLFLTNFFSRELTCWSLLLARTFAMFSLHSTDSTNIASFPDFLLPQRNAIFSRKVSNVPRFNNFLQTQGNIFRSWKKIMYT